MEIEIAFKNTVHTWTRDIPVDVYIWCLEYSLYLNWLYSKQQCLQIPNVKIHWNTVNLSINCNFFFISISCRISNTIWGCQDPSIRSSCSWKKQVCKKPSGALVYMTFEQCWCVFRLGGSSRSVRAGSSSSYLAGLMQWSSLPRFMLCTEKHRTSWPTMSLIFVRNSLMWIQLSCNIYNNWWVFS